MKTTRTASAALTLAVLALVGCTPTQPTAVHPSGLEVLSQTKQSLSWSPDGVNTYEGYGDPTVFVSDGFDITGEGPIGGATLLPDGTMQVVSQSDAHIDRLTRTQPDGTTFTIEGLNLNPSLTRSARAEALDRFATIFADLSETQREEIRERYETFRVGVTEVSNMAGSALADALVPGP